MKLFAWVCRPGVVWAVLALPLILVEVWLVCTIGGYGWGRFTGDVFFAVALSGLLLLIARWRVFGVAAGFLAWIGYLLVLLVALAESVSFYFQGSGFNDRFFANLRLINLRSALDAFPGVAVICALGATAVLILSGWLLIRQSALHARDEFIHAVFKGLALVVLVAAIVLLPSAPRRLSAYFSGYLHAGTLAASEHGRFAAGHVNFAPVTRDALTARAGKNLVIIYMESLERIYTDNAIFPGLAPNLNHYRAHALDFAGYLTFDGANYTMAGLFSSQCGVPYYNNPWTAYWYANNDNSDISFQPELVCLGDVLRVAGYRQVFMNGSPLSFADQGEFFKLHGYDEEDGLDELEQAKGDKLRESGWGLYDSELFSLAEKKFERLSSAGKPFNLTLLTIDNHPPHGRPSPGCPVYKAGAPSTLQSVHCTDYLVGRFLDAISRNPAWKNTVVVVMSDHQAMPNDARPLYPKWYVRRPLLFILNAGQGVRHQRFYHMDIAPTVLDLMGVRTDADFMAGADRSAANAPDSPLVNDPATAAVLRNAVWALVKPVDLCRNDVLAEFDQDKGFGVGGRWVGLSSNGVRSIGINSTQLLALLIGSNDIKPLAGARDRIASSLRSQRGRHGLVFTPDTSVPDTTAFGVDWLGRQGSRFHLGNVPRLSGLRITLPDCAAQIERMDRASDSVADPVRWSVRTEPLYPRIPALPSSLDFRTPVAGMLERDLGWYHWQGGGSWTSGDAVAIGFRLPPQHCHGADAVFQVHPFLAPSRPALDVDVFVNGVKSAQWQMAGAVDERSELVPIRTRDAQCRVDILFRFVRPGSAHPPFPAGEDQRPLELEFINMTISPPTQEARRAPM